MKKSILFILGVIGTGLLLVIFVYFIIVINTDKYIYDDIDKLPKAQTAMILGARVLPNETLSAVLQHRVDMALLLYKNKKVEKILMTGDNGSITYNEVRPVKEYLLKEGVLEEDIFLDHAGFDTYSSMYRAREIFLVKSVIVVSQAFHLPRAVYIARHLGIESYGIKADQGHYSLRNYIREPFSSIKAVMNVWTHRIPRFLGEEIPIDGASQ